MWRAMPELSGLSKYVRFVHTENLIHNSDQQTSYSVKEADRPADGLARGQTYGWESVPLGRLLRSGTSLSLHIDNCATTMGPAELRFGAGRGAQGVVVCLIGSGVGASIIANGAALRGFTASAGEWGHTTVMVAAARGRSLRHLFAETSIELGRLGPDAVTLGAATLPIEAFLGGNVFTTREVAQRAR